jgi:hypothetical protein
MLSKSISMAQWANKSHLNLSTAGDQYLSSYYSTSIFIFSFGCDHKPHDSNYCQVLARKNTGLRNTWKLQHEPALVQASILVPLYLITIMRPRNNNECYWIYVLMWHARHLIVPLIATRIPFFLSQILFPLKALFSKLDIGH